MSDFPNIFQMVDLSTAHLTEALGGEDAGILKIKGISVSALECGYLLTVPEDIDETVAEQAKSVGGPIPEVIVNIWRFAEEHGCEYVLFDRDASTIEELATYDW